VKFDNTQINIMLQTAKGAGELTDQDVARLSEQVGVQVATQFHQAVQSVNNRGAPPQLMAATGPS
jgi:aminoglycoside phosphotransferase family enzyme